MNIIEVNIDENVIKELTKKPEYKYWTVSESGDIDEKFVPEEEIYPSYQISANRLNEMNWLTQIFKKVGPDWPDEKKMEFYFAYVEALINAGFKSIFKAIFSFLNNSSIFLYLNKCAEPLNIVGPDTPKCVNNISPKSS